MPSPAYGAMATRSARVIALVMAGLASSAAQGAELATDWSKDHPETKARLSAGKSGGKLVAAVEVELADGWKTYWRFPGDGGGVPPSFDWEKSTNVASAKVLYPEPLRMADKVGDTLGYKGSVIYPVLIEPKDPTQPVVLDLAFDYGICRDVCVPALAALKLTIPAGHATPSPAAVESALKRVPRTPETRAPNDPKFIKAIAKLDGPKPTLTIEAEFPGGTKDADVFVESPNGFYIPLPKPKSGQPLGTNSLRFEIDLTGAVDPADIKGKAALVTMVSPAGASQASFTFD
jgi:DsbC/DsbD-like thiol-disulfide interchange protein